MRKVVLITGASSQLGRSIAAAFKRKGFIVYCSGRDIKKIQNSKNIKKIVLDITSNKSVKTAISTILKTEKRLDILINAAGNTIVGVGTNYRDLDFLELFDTNTVGAFRLIREVVPIMKKQGGGRIINISSLNGLISFPNFSVYSATKHALNALSRALYYENIRDNIFVTNISPGAIYSGNGNFSMPHKPAREKFLVLRILLPMVTVGKISDKILEISVAKNPPSSVILGRDAQLMNFLYRILPTRLFDRLMLFVWQKK